MNVKYNFHLFILFLLNLQLYSQDHFINYDKVKVENIALIEESFNSKVNESQFEHVESKNASIIRYGKLKKYTRPINESFGKIFVTYYYLKDDIFVRRTNYNWITSKDSKLKDYSKQFDKIVKKIATDLDLSIGKQGKLSKKMDDTVNGIPIELTERRVYWEYNDAKILILMAWTEKHGGSLHIQIENK